MSDRIAKPAPARDIDVTNLPVVLSSEPLLNEALNSVYTSVWVPITTELCPNECDGQLEAIWAPWFAYARPDTTEQIEHVLALKCPSCGWMARTDDRLPTPSMPAPRPAIPKQK